MLNPNETYQRKPKVLWQRAIELADHPSISSALEDDQLGLEEDACWAVLSFQGRQFELNATAALSWEILQAPVTTETLANAIAQYFSGSDQESAEVASDFIEQMLASGLIISVAR